MTPRERYRARRAVAQRLDARWTVKLMRMRIQRSVPGCLLVLTSAMALGACGPAAPPPKPAAEPKKPWDDWQRSATWLHATSDLKGGAAQECEHVLGQLEAESVCKGLLCRAALDLATEWREKCAKEHTATAPDVAALEASFRERLDAQPTACSKELDVLLRDGCSVSGCAERAQAWLTKCADAEAGPLMVSKLIRTVERALDPNEELTLDPRSCTALAKSILPGARCSDQPSCSAVGPEIDAYTTRCLSTGETPTLETGLAMFSVAIGIGKTPEPQFVASATGQVTSDMSPLALADGSGAVLAACGRRMVSVDDYFATRERCPGSPLTLVQVETLKGGGARQLQLGQLPLPDSATLHRLYPSLRIVGEQQHAQEAELNAAKEDWKDVMVAGSDVTLPALLGFVDRYADVIARSEELRQAMRAADAALVPMFRKLGEARTIALRNSRDVLLQRGVLYRARRRALSDITLDGIARMGAPTRASFIDTSRIWPSATQAHYAALGPVERVLKVLPRPLDSTVDEQLERARVQSVTCGVAETARLTAERELRECVFTACDDARREALTQQWDDARAERDAARIELDLALSALEATAADSQLSVIPACLPPSW